MTNKCHFNHCYNSQLCWCEFLV